MRWQQLLGEVEGTGTTGSERPACIAVFSERGFRRAVARVDAAVGRSVTGARPSMTAAVTLRPEDADRDRDQD
jgi:hypothetical protein